MALPYNGICLDTSEVIADCYMQSSDFNILDTYSYLMKRLQPQRLTGGAVIMNKDAFFNLGGENENYYGWGDDDYDRYIRFYQSGAPIFRSNTPLFHLSHPRGENSRFSSSAFAIASKIELSKTASHKRWEYSATHTVKSSTSSLDVLIPLSALLTVPPVSCMMWNWRFAQQKHTSALSRLKASIIQCNQSRWFCVVQSMA